MPGGVDFIEAMNSRRSRSGETSITKSASRKYRSGPNAAAATASRKSRLGAATTLDGDRVDLTFYWPADDRWEEVDFLICVE
jgi:hypothetical protein